MTASRPRPSATKRARPVIPRMPAAIAFLCVLAGFGVFAARATAQDAWSPIVVTSPGGTLATPLDAPVPHTSVTVDPRFFPSDQERPRIVPKVLPQGVWSPIVTGAIPKAPRPLPAPARTPAVDPMSPVRPLAPMEAIADGEDAEIAPLDIADKPPAQPDASGAPAAAAGDAPAQDGSFFKKPGPLDALPPNATAAQQYCFNTTDSAADARFAWQTKQIKDMEAELDKRIQRLHVKTEEYKAWLERRDAFSRKAHEKLVGFYSRMRPDAAAVQLATIDENVASAVMTKLETKVASAIMGEMDPERAAKIATIISGAAKVPGPKRQAPAQAAAPQTADGQEAATPPAVQEEPRT